MSYEPPRQKAETFICLVEIHGQLLKAIRRAQEVLEQPMPDTFLGRKTQEPFPKQE
jgi:hypothetical protein